MAVKLALILLLIVTVHRAFAVTCFDATALNVTQNEDAAYDVFVVFIDETTTRGTLEVIAREIAAADTSTNARMVVVAVGPSVPTERASSVLSIHESLGNRAVLRGVVAIGWVSGERAAAAGLHSVVTRCAREAGCQESLVCKHHERLPALFTDAITQERLTEWTLKVPITKHWSEISSGRQYAHISSTVGYSSVGVIKRATTVAEFEIVVIPNECTNYSVDADDDDVETTNSGVHYATPFARALAQLDALANTLVDQGIAAGTGAAVSWLTNTPMQLETARVQFGTSEDAQCIQENKHTTASMTLVVLGKMFDSATTRAVDLLGRALRAASSSSYFAGLVLLHALIVMPLLFYCTTMMAVDRATQLAGNNLAARLRDQHAVVAAAIQHRGNGTNGETAVMPRSTYDDIWVNVPPET